MSSFKGRVSDELIFNVFDVQFIFFVKSLKSNDRFVFKVEGAGEIFDTDLENVMSFLSVSPGFRVFISMDIIVPLIVSFSLLSALDIKANSGKLVFESASAEVHVFDSFVIN